MKKFVASLVVLLCLLFGSALAAEGRIVICGTTCTVNETPSYLKVSGSGAVSEGTASSYNVKLQMQNGVMVVTFKNVNIQYNGKILYPTEYSSTMPLTIVGEGKNTLKSTADAQSTLSWFKDMELKGSFDTITGLDAVIYGDGNILISANIQSLGGSESHSAVYSTGDMTISGNIGRIQSGQNGLLAQEGDIQIDGTIGRIDYGEGFMGICCLMNGKLTINNSVGPINVSGSTNGFEKAVTTRDGIELGEGISLLLPKNGGILYSNSRYVVCDENGNATLIAQFGKPAAPATGDSMNIVLWASLLTLSLIGIAVLSRRAKREY